jgi:hypothetical protein
LVSTVRQKNLIARNLSIARQTPPNQPLLFPIFIAIWHKSNAGER